MQILKNYSIPQAWRTQCEEDRGIKRHVFSIVLDFYKTHQFHEEKEFWEALKTVPETAWKGLLEMAVLEDSQKKITKGNESRWAEKYATRKTCQ